MYYSASKNAGKKERTLTWREVYNVVKDGYRKTGSGFYDVEPLIDKVLAKNPLYSNSEEKMKRIMRRRAIFETDIALASDKTDFFGVEYMRFDYRALSFMKVACSTVGLVPLLKTIQTLILPLLHFTRELEISVVRHLRLDHVPSAPEIIGPVAITAFFAAFVGFAHRNTARIRDLFYEVGGKLEDVVTETVNFVHEHMNGAAEPQQGRDLTKYYAVLEVQPGAGRDGIRKAYLGLAKQYHTDRNHGISEEKIKSITEAYREIMNANGWK